MTRFKALGSTALAMIFVSSGAFADVTPESVWESWKAQMESAGQTVTTTSAAADGGDFVVEGLTFTSDDGAGSKMSGTIDEVVFADLGDGTVEITMSDSFPITLTVPGTEGGSPTDLTLTVSQPGLSLLASGDETTTEYDIDAPTMNIKLASVAGTDASAVDLVVDATLTGTTGFYSFAQDGENSDLSSEVSTASASFVVTAKDPETQGDIRMTAQITDLSSISSGTILPATAMADMAAAFAAGFGVDTALTYGKTSFDFDITEAGKPTKIVGSADGGAFNVALNKDQMSYGSAMNQASFTLSGGDIPFPEVTVGYGEGAFNLTMPVSKSDTPQPFTFLTKLVDFTISDDIWGMLDPTATLPRDPATVIIDTKGTANWSYDIMDPAQQEAMAGQVPGQLHSLDLTNITAKAIGAEITGGGALTFDNTDLVTWEGAPAPTGTINLTIKGANGVIDKLVAMGLIPEDQAMGTRMMIAMFAKAGEGDDVLTSTLEFRDKGFFANGQQLR